MNNEEIKTDIYTAIQQVMKQVGYVQKGGKVNFGNTRYSYASEADLIAALRPAMIEASITFHCANIEIIQQQPTLMCMYKYTFTHAPSGTCIDVQVIGEGKDITRDGKQGDKASYKAATGALKYALRQTFIIETGDDPDRISSEEILAKEREAKERYKEEKKKKDHEEVHRQAQKLEKINIINNMIEEMSNQQKVEMTKMLETYSTYTDKDMNIKKGVKTFRGISDAQLAATFTNVTNAYNEWEKR